MKKLLVAGLAVLMSSAVYANSTTYDNMQDWQNKAQSSINYIQSQGYTVKRVLSYSAMCDVSGKFDWNALSFYAVDKNNTEIHGIYCGGNIYLRSK